MEIEIQFLGGAGTVTGSKYLLKYGDRSLLIDCGLFQGLKSLRLKNWDGFPIDASKLDAILLTHAHIDHSGFIPRLIKKGFRGKIYSTAPTKDLCEILLPDCGHILEEEAAYLNKKKRSKHSPALPLFTADEARDALKYFAAVPINKKILLNSSLTFEFRYAGHILGAASIIIRVGGKTIGFTGDVGRLEDRIFHAPEILPEVDYLVTESTYGNRLHKNIDPAEEIARVVNETFDRKGAVIIPAFAVGRAQAIIYSLLLLREEDRIPKIPIYLNSPMATKCSDLFRRHQAFHRLTEEQCEKMDELVTIVNSVEESKSLNEQKGPMVIISASGMLTGGRVLHHIKAFGPSPENTILLSGFQSAGTRGEALQNGASEIKIHGQYVPIRAKIEVLDNVSAHADYGELITWFLNSKIAPKKVFVTHGESSAADEFRRRLTETFGWNCYVPERGEAIRLD